MTQQGAATRAIAKRVQGLRKQKNLSARRLGELCAEAGAPQLNRSVIANLEAGRRPSLSVDELFVLARVLDESPLSLLHQVPDDLISEFGELQMLANQLLLGQVDKEGRPDQPTARLTVEGAGSWVLSTRYDWL